MKGRTREMTMDQPYIEVEQEDIYAGGDDTRSPRSNGSTGVKSVSGEVSRVEAWSVELPLFLAELGYSSDQPIDGTLAEIQDFGVFGMNCHWFQSSLVR